MRGFLDADLHPSVPDTELAVRFTPDPGGYCGEEILPVRPVQKKNDLIRQINQANIVQRRDLRVGGRGNLAKVQFRLDANQSYFAADYAVTAWCDNGERAQADSILQYDQEQLFTAVEAYKVNSELVLTGVLRDTNVMTQNYTVTAVEYFNDYNATGDGPFRIIKNGIENVVLSTGGRAGSENSVGVLRITMHRWTWSYLSEHPDILGKAPVHTLPAGAQTMTQEMFLKALGFSESAVGKGKVQLRIVAGFYNSADEDATPSYQSYIGRDIIISYTEAQSPRSMSLGYTMAWAGPQANGEPSGLPLVVYRVPMPWEGQHGGEMVKVVGSYDAKIIFPGAGFLIKNALDPNLSKAFL